MNDAFVETSGQRDTAVVSGRIKGVVFDCTDARAHERGDAFNDWEVVRGVLAVEPNGFVIGGSRGGLFSGVARSIDESCSSACVREG